MKNNVLITVASWEERFLEGIKSTIEKNEHVDTIYLLFVKEYREWSDSNIDLLKLVLNEKGINLRETELSFKTPYDNWHAVQVLIDKIGNIDDLIVDFTTMPRSILWYVLFFLKYRKFSIRYVYHKPETYNQEWQSRNPDSPRLVYKLSGISQLGRPTVLVIFTGYDLERVEHLIKFFEPKTIRLLVQNTVDFNNPEYFKLYSELYKNKDSCIIEGFDSYNIETTTDKITKVVDEMKASHNVIIASLGPKTSAISVFNYVSLNPDVGVCYVPSKEFNRDYSKGIGNCIEGTLDFTE